MSKPKIKTLPDMSASSPIHKEVMEMGDERFRLWQRNVADKFKSMPDEEVRAELKRTANPFAVCFENWTGDFNISTGVRNANAFNAEAVYYVGNKKWDRRGAVGVHNYTDVIFLPTVDDLAALKSKYHFIGVDNVPGSIDIATHMWETNSLLIFGEEGTGLTPAMQAMCDVIVEIPMFGSVRSLNCGTTSGIVMYDFIRLVC